jgi:hypothetical protein
MTEGIVISDRDATYPDFDRRHFEAELSSREADHGTRRASR